MESLSSASYSKCDDGPCLVFSRVENWYWDVRTTGETRCNFLVSDTRIPTWFLSRGNSAWWNRAICCEWGNTSWKIGETRCWSSKRSKATTICHWKRWNRIRIVSGIKSIREPGEWSSAKKTEKNFQRCRRRRRTFYYLGNVHDCNNGVFMGKNHLNNCQSIANTKDLTLRQMFDISTRLVGEQDDISNLETIRWEKHSWKYLSLIRDETIINLQRAKVYVFSDSVLCLGKIHQHPNDNESWKERIEWIASSQSYRNFDRIDGEPMEFEWNISQDSIRCSSVKKSNVYCWE